MLKKILILLSLFLLIPLASADLEITDISQNIYNLGEKIYLNVYAEQNKDISVLLKVSINCNDYELPYFMTPLNLKANKRVEIEIPSLNVDKSLLGICRIIANVKSNEGEIIETARSEEFEATKDLNVSFISDKEEYDPGETAELRIDMRTKYGYDIENPEINIFIDSSRIASFNETRIRYELSVPEKISAGEHTISLEVKDENENIGDASEEIIISQIPTRISYNLNKERFLPGEILEIKPLLYDQADEAIQEILTLIIKDPDNNPIYNDNAESGVNYNYNFDKYAAPGEYSVLIKYEGISNESYIEVDEYLDFEINLKGEVVYVKNTGNIHFNDKKSIIVKSDSKNYVISRKIDLAPGEEMQIDLSKELPEGKYDVVLPSYDAKTKEFDEVSLEGVDINDSRSIAKKTKDGLFSITGAVVTVGGFLKPSIAAIILIIIILGLSVYFYFKGNEEE